MSEYNIWQGCLKKADKENVLTKFLDETELSELLKIAGPNYYVKINGAFEQAERVRAIISTEDENFTREDYQIAILKVNYPVKYVKITHRNILGTLMSLGINRNIIGDIIVSNDDNPQIFFMVVQEMVQYLQNNLMAINNYPISLEQVSDSDLRNIQVKDGLVKDIIISSMRLDVIISAVLNVSRSDTNSLFDEQKIFVNHIVCINHHYGCQINDLISVRKYGRFSLIGDIRMTKKNNYVLTIKVWR